MADDEELGTVLLQLARDAIGEEFGMAPRPFAHLPRLVEAGASFVTLRQGRTLRGCIGSLAAYRALLDDVRANACNAAFSDPRFAPLAEPELTTTRIEVSLLSAPERLQFRDEEDALQRLRPHIDGVIFSMQQRRSTFLPQVWEDLPDPRRFMSQLKQKAGLPPDFWSPEVILERYQVKKWKEAIP